MPNRRAACELHAALWAGLFSARRAPSARASASTVGGPSGTSSVLLSRVTPRNVSAFRSSGNRTEDFVIGARSLRPVHPSPRSAEGAKGRGGGTAQQGDYAPPSAREQPSRRHRGRVASRYQRPGCHQRNPASYFLPPLTSRCRRSHGAPHLRLAWRFLPPHTTAIQVVLSRRPRRTG
jgi:hypothetical protein